MTLFGIDISNYQDNIDLRLVKAQGFSFCAAKATQAADYRSADYPRQRDQAKAIGLRFCAYHFLRPASVANISAQVGNLRGYIGDLSIPVMLDVESYNGSTPTSAEVSSFVTQARAAGLKVRWMYWQGDHPLLPGTLKWHAAYGTNPAGYASVIYPGDGDSHWNTAVPTTIWQYGSRGKLDGWSGDLDFNAFRGTLADLDALDGFTKPAETPEEDMAVSDADATKIALRVLDIIHIPNKNDPSGASAGNQSLTSAVTNIEATQDVDHGTLGKHTTSLAGLSAELDAMKAAQATQAAQLTAVANGVQTLASNLSVAVTAAVRQALADNVVAVDVTVHGNQT